MSATNGGVEAAREYDAVRASLDNIAASSDKVSTSLAKTFSSAIASGKSFDQTLQSIAQNLSKTTLTSALTPITGALTAGVNGVLSSLLGGLSGGASTTIAAQPFASGGVVAQPTFFGSAGGLGLMGEQGAEAILPLARGPGGQLGVMNHGQGGGAPNVNVNISTPDANSFQRSQVQLTGALARAVARGQRGL